ncbi:SDR family NAD(P)-dependent oxidoreductase [Subtercola boreus]|uniref:SDR family NAD(P)-dependent oxidoreductase n=1 Tax=Subtercola boreus TaxID=120213 RepID=UPI001FED1CF4|nr:SDR family NAD(P)-dependent oxidoreductase [Subtercola boreus]
MPSERRHALEEHHEPLSDLGEKYGDAVLPLRLDVTDRAQVNAAVKAAHDTFGRLDVVINNAGYGLFGTVEEITQQQLHDQLETNLFGVFNVTQAVLPLMREQGSGHTGSASPSGPSGRPSLAKPKAGSTTRPPGRVDRSAPLLDQVTW